MVHAVKAAKEEQLEPTRSWDRVRAVAVWRLSAELADRPLPSIAFNYLGNQGAGFGSSDGNGDVPGFLPAGDAPSLPVTVSGLLPTATAVLAVDATVVPGPAGAVLQVELRYPAVLGDRCRRSHAARWDEQLCAITDAVAGVRLGCRRRMYPARWSGRGCRGHPG